MPEPTISQSVVVKDEIGLHVRPAEMLARAANGFESSIELVYQQQHADAKSIMHMLTLGARQDAVLEVQATGPDAAEAVATLAALFQSNFETEPQPTQSLPTEGGAPPDGALS